MRYEIPEWGDWGCGDYDGDYTPPGERVRYYFMGQCGEHTVWGTFRAPATWTRKRIREHGFMPYVKTLSLSRDILLLRHIAARD